MRAGTAKSGQEQAAALESLCRSYWLPIYGYIRSRGNSAEDAQDLTQGFFLHILGGTFMMRANPERGRFRSFLLGALKNYLSDSKDRERASKRGGAAEVLSLDFASGESAIQHEPSHSDTPERIFQRQWASTVLDAALAKLRHEFALQGKLDRFDCLKGYLGGAPPPKGGLDLAALGLSESAVKNAIYRLRRRYRDLLRSEVAATVEDDSEIDSELRFLLQAVSSRAELL